MARMQKQELAQPDQITSGGLTALVRPGRTGGRRPRWRGLAKPRVAERAAIGFLRSSVHGLIAAGLVVATLVASGLGCSGPGTGVQPDKPKDLELAFQRAARWTGVVLQGSSLTGPRMNVRLKEAQVTGFIDGQGFSLDLDEQGLGGVGTSGNIAADVESVPGAVGISGTWNGSRVRLVADQKKIDGTVPILGGRGDNTFVNVLNCQYQLERSETEPNVYEGVSVCQGLPEQTRIELDPRFWRLEPRKAAAIILLLLQAPPRSYSEALIQ